MKKKNCYALFIGIDQYDNAQIPNLSGCIKDAERLAHYIQTQLNTDLYKLHLKTLFTGTSTPPTRQAIIENIQTHLGQAQAQDMVLLFYAGHGSKEKAHPHFEEADGNLQTLVPCDARNSTPEGQIVKNILDKELRFLLYELWKTERPELIFIQDSCHSTGATRQAEQLAMVHQDLEQLEQELQQENTTTPIFTPPIPRFTEPTDYEKSGRFWEEATADQLLQVYTAFKAAPELLQTALDNIQSGKGAFDNLFPLAEHIHLAACDKHQFAYEIPNKGGVFTSNLIEILEAAQNTISYQDLFNRIRMNIGGVYQQTPDLFVHSPNFQKRHEIFLGDLLLHHERSSQRDIDVFKGFYPVVPKGREGWQIKAGEMELLPSLDGKIKAIPIEVFLQDQQPVGMTNAVIDYVASGYSQVSLTTASFDRRKHRNQLYAMIPPQYMRRWRIPVWVATGGATESLTQLFDNYPPRKNLKNFQSDGGPAIRLAKQKSEANFWLIAKEDALFLYTQEEQLLFKAAAIEYYKNGQKITLPFIQKPNDSSLYRYKKGKETPLEWQEDYTLTKKLSSFIPPIFDYLAHQYQQNTSKNIMVFCEQEQQENAFLRFQKDQQNILDYYNAFIRWTGPEKADYVVQTTTDGFEVLPYTNNEIAAVPAFQRTAGLSTQDGFRIILGLQKMCKWKTVQNLYNKLQLQTLAQHQFEFSFKLYQQLMEKTIEQDIDYNLPHQPLSIESWNEAHFSQSERGTTIFLNDLSSSDKPIHFLTHPSHSTIVRLDFSLIIKHLKGNQAVYVSTLLLDSNFSVLPLQQSIGCNLLPPQHNSTDGRGTLVLNDLSFVQPKQMVYFPNEIQSVTFYIKIFMAYQRFDISGLLQTGLAPAAPQASDYASENASSKHRSLLKKPPKAEDTGSWMSFTIPIRIQQTI